MFKTMILLLLLLIPVAIFAKATPLRMGDHLLKRGEYEEALEEYRKVEADNPNDPQALWRIGAALTRIALTGIGNARHEYLEEATNYLNRSIVADHSICEAHLEYARALGYLALFKPDWDDVRVARRVREELLIVLNEDPDDSDAVFLMGMWHKWVSPMPLLKRKPSGLGSASIDSSLYYLRRAVKLDDDNLEFKLQLGLGYICFGSEPAGEKILEDLANMKKVPDIYADIPERARESLEKREIEGELDE